MPDFQRVNFNPQVAAASFFSPFFLSPRVMMDERSGYIREREQTVLCSHAAVILILSVGVDEECLSLHIVYFGYFGELHLQAY